METYYDESSFLSVCPEPDGGQSTRPSQRWGLVRPVLHAVMRQQQR